MITRLLDGGWALIRQMDHAEHCGEIARAWRKGPFGAGSVSGALLHAAALHDLGWTDVDRRPELDSDGNPRNFTQIDEARHTKFYSGAVREIAKSNPAAAYLVSLHASGLYSRRYAWAGLKPVDWTKIGPHGTSLLDEERRFRTELSSKIAGDELEFEAAWRSYMLLETFDYLSLLTCFGFDSRGCSPVPTYAWQWESLTVRRLGPWTVELDPFPFAGNLLAVEVDVVRVEAGYETAEELCRRYESAPRRKQRTEYRAA
jgi:Protein of unknown function (DUF3891)